MTLISLFTDASFDHKRHTAGWGAWARHDAKRVYNGGGVNHTVKDATEAEMIAMWEGINMLRRCLMFSDDVQDDVIIQIDNMRVATCLPWWWPHDRPKGVGPSASHKRPAPRTYHERRIMEALTKFNLEHPYVRLIGRHVKGHNRRGMREGEKRSVVNDIVDRLASRGRQMAQRQKETRGFPTDEEVALFPLLLYPQDRVELYKPRAKNPALPDLPENVIDFSRLND